MAEDTRKNILEVDTVQSIDKTDTVLVNDSNSLKQVSVETLVSSGIPDQYVTESELSGKGYATTVAMNSGLKGKIDKNQGSGNSGKYLSVGSDGNVTLVDAPSSGSEGGITEETDPTVPSWAKNPTKPTYTADEVGALPDDTEIPSKTSDLENDSGFITNSDIPEKLPNPQKIIFTGAVSVEYDGTTQQTVNIPNSGGSGGSYTLPIMSSVQLGGGKAVSKTDEDVPVAVDPSTGQLFVPTYPDTGDSAVTPRQEMTSSDTTVTLEPNKLYVFPEMASLTVTLATPSDTNVANEYHFFFISGSTATTLALNDVLSDAYSIEANMKYEVSILEGVAYIKGVSMGET